MNRLHALNRISEVEEVARAVIFLASDESSIVTGSAMVIDGGCRRSAWPEREGASVPAPRSTLRRMNAVHWEETMVSPELRAANENAELVDRAWSTFPEASIRRPVCWIRR